MATAIVRIFFFSRCQEPNLSTLSLTGMIRSEDGSFSASGKSLLVLSEKYRIAKAGQEGGVLVLARLFHRKHVSCLFNFICILEEQ